jgi:benzodiazapine receptor
MMENAITKRSGHAVALVGWLALCFAVAGISGAFSANAITTWYAALVKPDFNPPNQLWGPIWTVLYIMMAVAAWMVWKSPGSRARTRALVLFCMQLALNLSWSAIFFTRHQIGAALVEILLLWLAILATMLGFFTVRRDAAWLLIPYLAWVSFAAYLNWAIWKLN